LKTKFSTKSIKNLLGNGTIANTAVKPQTQQVNQRIVPSRRAPPPPITNKTQQEEESPVVISDSDSFSSEIEEIPARNEETIKNETGKLTMPTEVKSSTQDFSDDSLFEIMEIESSEKDPQDSE